ncbi:MAG TPA: alpha/beta hydrolase [Chitinophagaceae bacterium]|nr:alpha/beta hydrolase [Chitinophagaceae bacterium]
MNVYLISGLGADRHAFSRLTFPENCQVYALEWTEPYQNESLEEYARRMSATIIPNQPFVLVGLSFGGMVAIEIARLMNPEKIFLISSISCRSQLPQKYRIMGALGIHRSFFLRWVKSGNAWVHYYFGVRSGRIQQYLDERIQQTSLNYLRWSLEAILNWKEEKKNILIYQIHGTRDRIFPVRLIQAEKIIPGGGHFMVLTHAKSISACICNELEHLT